MVRLAQLVPKGRPAPKEQLAQLAQLDKLE
jgi:hypothetical protein